MRGRRRHGSARWWGTATSDDVADALLAAARETSDPLWRLPLWRPYLALLDSYIADFTNAGGSRHAGAITTQVAQEALELLEVDEQGLERIDRELLDAVASKFGGGPVGLSTLAVALGEEPDTIEDVYEPYLLQLGFLQRTPRGRVITEHGRAHLGAAHDEGSLF